MKVKIPGILRKMYPRRIWKGPAEERSIFLTFDDGPIPEVTPWVLEQLKKFNAKASFFCIGENVEKHPDIFEKVIAEGHSIGNHSFNHLNGWKTPQEEYVLNTLKAQQVLQKYASEAALNDHFFRPPYGKIRNGQARALVKKGFKIVMWDIVSQDYNRKISAEKCLQNVLKNATSGSIIVFHDSLKAQPTLEYALPRVLEHFSSRGYSFSSL